MKITKPLLPFAAIFLSGCAAVSFTPYEGSQQPAQPSSGAYVNREYGIPIYQGLPPRSYIVIGKIDASQRAMIPEGADHAAARVAKSKGADALILVTKDERTVGTQGYAPGWQGGYFASSNVDVESVKYLAIKWAR